MENQIDELLQKYGVPHLVEKFKGEYFITYIFDFYTFCDLKSNLFFAKISTAEEKISLRSLLMSSENDLKDMGLKIGELIAINAIRKNEQMPSTSKEVSSESIQMLDEPVNECLSPGSNLLRKRPFEESTSNDVLGMSLSDLLDDNHHGRYLKFKTRLVDKDREHITRMVMEQLLRKHKSYSIPHKVLAQAADMIAKFFNEDPCVYYISRSRSNTKIVNKYGGKLFNLYHNYRHDMKGYLSKNEVYIVKKIYIE